MKKITFILLCLFAFAINSEAQFPNPFKEKKVQVEANDQLAYVFGYLKSDTMIFKNIILPDPNTKVVMMHDAFGKSLYVLMANDVFDTTNAQIARLSALYGIYGLEFNLTYLSAFSWQSRRTIRKIDDPFQKAMTKVFNTKVKYCLMQQGSHTVKGTRILDKKSAYYGQIIPDFSEGATVAPPKNETPVTLPPTKPAVDSVTKSKTPVVTATKKDW